MEVYHTEGLMNENIVILFAKIYVFEWAKIYVFNYTSYSISERWVGKIENEGETPSKEVYNKWLLTIYGKLKPVKKENTKTKKPITKKK